MTLAELHERIGWQIEGRLQMRVPFEGGVKWIDCVDSRVSWPYVYQDAALYRRRPDPPPMPDEVWVNHDGAFALSKHFMEGSVRYVRVGAIIPASQMQFRQRICNWEWSDCIETNEYRIKP